MNAKQVVEYVESLTQLKSDREHIYYLTHTYNLDKNKKVWVKAPYQPEVFEVICAYVQYELAEFDQSISMDEEDLLEVLEKLYDCTGKFSCTKEEKKQAIEIDLYENWEIYCGQIAKRIMNMELLKRDGLNELLSKYAEKFYEQHPEFKKEVGG
jgi:hypothetical protein